MNTPLLKPIPQSAAEKGLWQRLASFWQAKTSYEVAEEFRALVQVDGQWQTLILPKGFQTDLASTPHFSWGYGFKPDAPALLLPSLWHDFYYRYGYYIAQGDWGQWERICQGRGRHFADREFARQVAQASGLKTPAWLARLALWAGGWAAWNSHKKTRGEQ